ncbi:MAG: chromosomal replication initiator protein DnaA [Actinobacteria bacterium]|nr:chromosomal replication initiator protein DnaA [Actinomycetota bacterium]MBM3697523.1 chromosomal replication initiator protein DnaA [Actinomycetota bacterium]
MSSSVPIIQDEERLAAIWQQVLDRLRGALNSATYSLTFERARALGLDSGHFRIGVETEFARGWVVQRYDSLVRDALFEVLGHDVVVNVEVVAPVDPLAGIPAPVVATQAAPRAGAPAPPSPTEISSRLQGRFTFEALVVGPSNRFAHAAALAVAETPARAYNPLFIYGGVGLGKTHLLHAIGHYVAENHPGLSLRYVSVETFTNEFIDALRDGGIRSFKDRYRSTDILLIDDIQMLEGREQTQEEFFHTFNALHEHGKQIVISSDRPPSAIKALEDRLRSRFEMGLITDVQPPDLELRIAILRKRVQTDNYQIRDPEVLSFIAARVSTNVRQLEGALIRVVAHSSISGRPVTVDLAQEVLTDLFPGGPAGEVRIDLIQEAVTRHYAISIDELVGEKRTKRVVMPRQVAMYLSRELTDASLPTIGRAFGGRDHTTVIYAVQKVTKLLADGGEVYEAVQALTTSLTGAGGGRSSAPQG